MPRNPGTGVYTQPAPDVVSGTTVESKVYNDFVNDVELDLNTPRPVVAGGTGASSAAAARANLKAEVAGQQVTNYDTQVWEDGSFWSLTGATNAPVASTNITGTCVVVGAGPDYITLEARDNATGINYVRLKQAGVWGAWTSDQTSNDARYVNVTGDTMTGDLVISKNNPQIALRKTTSTEVAAIYGMVSSALRWGLQLGDGTSETGSNVGSNFTLLRFDDAGNILGSPPLAIARSTGQVNMANNLVVGTAITAGTSITATGNITSTGGNLFLTNGLQVGGSAPIGLGWDGTNITLRTSVSGAVYLQPASGSTTFATFGPIDNLLNGSTTCLADIIAKGNMYVGNGSATVGTLAFTNSGSRYLQYSSGQFYLSGGTLNCTELWVNSTSGSPAFAHTQGIVLLNTGEIKTFKYAGPAIETGRSTDGNTVQFFNNAGSLCGSIAMGGGGTTTAFNTSSDMRLKEDLKSFEAGNIVDDTNVYDFAWKSTGERSYGIIAQQAKEVYPAAVTYEKDSDWWGIDYSRYVPVILQELKALRARVAELEGRLEAGAQPA